MTPADEFTRQLEGYLDGYEGSTPLPEVVRDAIRAQLPSTHQRPAWWPARRLPEMNNIAKLTLAAAAVLAVAFLGWRFMLPANVGGPGLGDPTVPAATPSSEPRPLIEGSTGPGTFTATPARDDSVETPPRITFDAPAGWSGIQPWLIGSDDDAATLLFVQPSGLYSDPCLANQGSPDIPVGSTAAELASALDAHSSYDASITGETVIDGYDAIRMRLLTPSDFDYTACQLGQFWVWDGPFFSEAPSEWDLWIIDLGGMTTVVLAEYDDGTADQDQIEGMVQSIRIDPQQ